MSHDPEKELLYDLSVFSSFPIESQPNTIQALTASQLLRVVDEKKFDTCTVKSYIVDDFLKFKCNKETNPPIKLDGLNQDYVTWTPDDKTSIGYYLDTIHKKHVFKNWFCALSDCIIVDNHIVFVKASKEFESDSNIYVFITNGSYALKVISNSDITELLSQNALYNLVKKLCYETTGGFQLESLKNYGLDLLSSLDTDLPVYTYKYRRIYKDLFIYKDSFSHNTFIFGSTILSSIDKDDIEDIDEYRNSLNKLTSMIKTYENPLFVDKLVFDNQVDYDGFNHFLHTIYDDLRNNSKDNQAKRFELKSFFVSYVEEKIERQITIMIETKDTRHMMVILIPYSESYWYTFLHMIKLLKRKYLRYVIQGKGN